MGLLCTVVGILLLTTPTLLDSDCELYMEAVAYSANYWMVSIIKR